MAARWRRGETVRAEDYLDRHPELREVPDAALELLSEEICLRQEAGVEPRATDLVRRFPRWERQGRALLACHRLLAGGPPPRFSGAGGMLGGVGALAPLGRGSPGPGFFARQPRPAGRRGVVTVGAR